MIQFHFFVRISWPNLIFDIVLHLYDNFVVILLKDKKKNHGRVKYCSIKQIVWV